MNRDSGGQPFDASYLILHCEEFAWPHVSPHTPVRSYITLCGPHHFTHHRRSKTAAGLFSVALVVIQTIECPPLAGCCPVVFGLSSPGPNSSLIIQM